MLQWLFWHVCFNASVALLALCSSGFQWLSGHREGSKQAVQEPSGMVGFMGLGEAGEQGVGVGGDHDVGQRGRGV